MCGDMNMCKQTASDGADGFVWMDCKGEAQ